MICKEITYYNSTGMVYFVDMLGAGGRGAVGTIADGDRVTDAATDAIVEGDSRSDECLGRRGDCVKRNCRDRSGSALRMGVAPSHVSAQLFA